MKQFSIAIALILGMACSSLHAQTVNMQANIPFAFWVGKTVMPAGPYELRYTSGVLRVQQDNGGQAIATVLPITEHGLKIPVNTALQFNRYGDTYILTKIWSPELQGECTLPKTSQEKEILSRNGAGDRTLVAVNRK